MTEVISKDTAITAVSINGEDKQSSNPDIEDPRPVVEDEKLTLRHLFLVIEIVLLSLAASYTEMCVVPAIPIMTEEWGDPSTIAYIPWVLSAFNIVGTISTSILGYLASVYGPKYPTIASFSLYALGQIGCALSNNIYSMVFFRAVQGTGMAVYTLFDSVVSVAFPRKYVPFMIGVISTENPIGTIIGLLGGSSLLDVFTRWQNMFWVTLPLPVIFGIGFFFSFKDSDSKKGSVMSNGECSEKPPFDWIGPIFFSLGLILFLSSFTLSNGRGLDWLVVTLLVVGLALLVTFYFVERKVEYPLIPVRLLKGNILIIMVSSAILGVSMVGLTQFLPSMLLSPESTVIKDKKMINIGAVMIPLGAVELVMSPVAGIIGEKIGFSLCIFIGASLQAVSLTLFTFFHYSITEVVVCLIIYGSSFSLIFVSCVNLIMSMVSLHEFSILCGTTLLVNLMGGSIGPILTDFISRKHMYFVPGESSSSGGSWMESTFCSDKGYTYAIMFTAITANVAFVCTFFLRDKFAVCSKGKNVNETPIDEEVESDKADETTRLIN